MNILKSISAKVLFKEFPALKKALSGGELWNDGYFVRSVGGSSDSRGNPSVYQASTSGTVKF